MPTGRNRRLATRAKVLWTGGLVGLAMGVALLALAFVERRAEDERVREHTVLMARVFADHATRSIDAAALATATLDELLTSGMAPDAPEFRATLAQTLVNLPFLRDIGIVDARGRVLASAHAADVGLVIDLRRLGALPAPGADRLGGFVAARRLADLRIASSAAVAPGVGFLPLISAAALRDGRTALVLALINADALSNFQQVTLADDRMAAALLAWDGQLLAGTAGVAPTAGRTMAALTPFTQFLPAREHGSWTGPGLRPGTQIASFRVSGRWPLLVAVEFDAAAARDAWWRGSRVPLGVGMSVLAFIVVMTMLASRSLLARDAAQAVVARREREMGLTLAGLQELVLRCDGEGLLRFVNPAWLRLAGGRAEDWLGRPLLERVARQDHGAARRLFEPGGGSREATLTLLDREDQPRLFEFSVSALADTPGDFVASAVDVTERAETRRRQQQQLAFTEMLLQSSPLPMSVMSRDRRYQIVNHAWEVFSGRRREEALGQPVGAHLPEAERRLHEAQDERVYATHEPVRYEARVPHADGTVRDVVIEKRVLPGAEGGTGEAAGILAVVIDVTEFRAAERATREARDAAEEASRAKSEFVANISHELRTPLQSIIGFSELGLRRAGEQVRLGAMFGDIHASGQRMLALVNDLLDVARIESSVGTIHLERADLRSAVREVLRELQPLAAERQVLLDDKTLPTLPMTVRMDPLRMQQVVRNVVANALRFSPAGASVEIGGAATDAGEWCLSVADRGPGIPAGELERIFEAFVQSSRTKDGSGGTGLGLAICRTIMQAHNGHITAANREGGGSVFEIVLPARGSGETLPMPL
jgi:PAS domain S-box-containing protein